MQENKKLWFQSYDVTKIKEALVIFIVEQIASAR